MLVPNDYVILYVSQTLHWHNVKCIYILVFEDSTRSAHDKLYRIKDKKHKRQYN